jgi:hypothetical protein
MSSSESDSVSSLLTHSGVERLNINLF